MFGATRKSYTVSHGHVTDKIKILTSHLPSPYLSTLLSAAILPVYSIWGVIRQTFILTRMKFLRRRSLHEQSDRISVWLRSTHNVAVTTRTLERRIHDWNPEPLRQRTEDSDELRDAIRKNSTKPPQMTRKCLLLLPKTAFQLGNELSNEFAQRWVSMDYYLLHKARRTWIFKSLRP